MNTLQGRIIEIQSSDRISLIRVEVDGDAFSSMVLEGKKGPVQYHRGDQVHLLFKETEVGIAKHLTGLISFRNRFAARIKKVERGSILTKVVLNYKGRFLESIISTKSAQEMILQEGDEVEWLVKTNEVSLMPIPTTQ
jgi:molybdate transport system regulatory protein